MKIIFGVPDITHRELADLEIAGIKKFGVDCDTVNFGPRYSKKGYINKLIITIKNARNINKILKKEKYDLLFLNTTFDATALIRDWLTLVILRKDKTKIFLKTHGTDLIFLNKLTKYQQSMFNWIVKRVAGLGVLSKEERKAFILKGYPEDKFVTIKNPIDPELYITDNNFKKNVGLDSSTFTFMFCSRFIQSKGLMDVLQAFKVVQSQFQNTHLFCIGDGPEMAPAKQFVSQHSLSMCITFTGFITEARTREFYANVDALVFPTTHQEGFPMVVFQSLAAGIPILTTRIRAAADYLDQPENVLWVEAHNHKQIAACMTTVLNDKKLVTNMRKNNLIKAREFTTEKNASEYVNIFNSIIKE